MFRCSFWGETLGFSKFSAPQIFETPGVIIMTIAATRMQRSLVNFASSDVYDRLLPSFFLLSTAYVILGYTRAPKWVVSHSQRSSRQTRHRLSQIGLRQPSTRPTDSIRKTQWIVMTRSPSSAQMSRYLISLVIHQSWVWLQNPLYQPSLHPTVFRRRRVSSRCLYFFVILYNTCTCCIKSLSGAVAASRDVEFIFIGNVSYFFPTQRTTAGSPQCALSVWSCTVIISLITPSFTRWGITWSGFWTGISGQI